MNDYLKDLGKDKHKDEIKDEELEKNNKTKKIFELMNENKKEENDKSNLDMSEFDNVNKKDIDTKSNLEEMIENKYQTNISFLSRDSNLTIDKNISLDDINILPNEIKEMNIFVSTATTKETIKKNLESNKLTQLLRSSVFDRNAVNTNINLTSNEQTNYYESVNQNLNKNLYVDLREPRKRKADALDVSCVKEERDYNKYLEHQEENIEVFKQKENEENKSDNFQLDEIKNLQSERVNLKTIQAKEFKNISNEFNEINDEGEKKGINSKKGGFYIFKAKSIEKNISKYPIENSNDFYVREENKPYTDPLTLKQESIPDNLRGKKFYMNYLYNILDKDLKVKDTFDVKHWEKEIYGRKDKYFKVKPLPESVEAFFVFNDKKLNLKKYLYQYHKDKIFEEDEYSILTHELKYLPNNVLQIMPIRIRNFGKYFVGKEINPGALGNKANSMNLMTFGAKSQTRSKNARSGEEFYFNFEKQK